MEQILALTILIFGFAKIKNRLQPQKASVHLVSSVTSACRNAWHLKNSQELNGMGSLEVSRLMNEFNFGSKRPD